MKKSCLVLGGLFLLFVVCGVAGGAWASSHGYYDALKGGLAQNRKDYPGAITHFKTAYEKNHECWMVANDVACNYSLMGDKESCFKWLKIALKTSYGSYAKKQARTEPDFNNVKDTPEFRKLIYE